MGSLPTRPPCCPHRGQALAGRRGRREWRGELAGARPHEKPPDRLLAADLGRWQSSLSMRCTPRMCSRPTTGCAAIPASCGWGAGGGGALPLQRQPLQPATACSGASPDRSGGRRECTSASMASTHMGWEAMTPGARACGQNSGCCREVTAGTAFCARWAVFHGEASKEALTYITI